MTDLSGTRTFGRARRAGTTIGNPLWVMVENWINPPITNQAQLRRSIAKRCTCQGFCSSCESKFNDMNRFSS